MADQQLGESDQCMRPDALCISFLKRLFLSEGGFRPTKIESLLVINDFDIKT